jgi:aminopeptidase YwaD
MTTLSDFGFTIAGDLELFRDYEAICRFGGRLAGTASEGLALDYVAARGAQVSGVPCHAIPVPYTGWRCIKTELALEDGTLAACHPLVRSVAVPQGRLTAEVVDLGRGTPEEFGVHRDEIVGRIVLVRHELMFVAGTVHRRRKYEMARAAGAVGFLIAGPIPNGLVAGSSGRGEGDAGIPAVGISPETAARLSRTACGWPRVTMQLDVVEEPTETRTLLFDMPGMTDEWVVLSAHVDGHDINESAIDNASGVAAALSVARALAPSVRAWRRGIRLAFFSVEEWALTGSARYVASLSEATRAKIALNVNLDSVAGSSRLAALTSGFAGLEPFLLTIAEAAGQDLRCVRPLLTNSDHANFALAGIPAFRLVAGYDDPMSNLRFVLTSGDTRDKVTKAELTAAAALAAAITAAACHAEPGEALSWRH